MTSSLDSDSQRRNILENNIQQKTAENHGQVIGNIVNSVAINNLTINIENTGTKHGSNSDEICDADEQEIPSPTISVDDFRELLKEYSICHKDEQLALSALDKIASQAWNLIVGDNNSQISNRNVEIKDFFSNNPQLKSLLSPLYSISGQKEITVSQILDFFEIGKVGGILCPDRYVLKNYSHLLRKLIIHLLYQAPTLLSNDEIFKGIKELISTEEAFWLQLFVDVNLRYKCGNIQTLHNRFIEIIESTSDIYKSRYHSSPLIELWSIITTPLETAKSQKKEDVLNIIRKSAEASTKGIEIKWCIAAATRILPLYADSEDEIDSSDFINSLFEKGFDKELVSKSSQIQSIYLKGLLKSFLYSKDYNYKYLVKYEKQFEKIFKIISDESKSHLQIEYACCIILLLESLSEWNYLEIFGQLIGKSIGKKHDSSKLIKTPLLENYRCKYMGFRKIDSFNDKKNINSFLIDYVTCIFIHYVQKCIESNHIALRDFPALIRVNKLGQRIAKSTILSLKKFRDSGDVYDSSFYARSTKILAYIPRRENISLIKDYVTRALEFDADTSEYSIFRNAKDIAWSLYSCRYYGEELWRSEIEALSSKFASITKILNESEEINDQVTPNISWAYYAGIKWTERVEEQSFVNEFYSIEFPSSMDKFSSGDDHNSEPAFFTNRMHEIISNYSKKSIFAAVIKKDFDKADVWRILGTTILDNKKFIGKEPTGSVLDNLEKSARFYSIARCFAKTSKENVQKHYYNYIRCKSLVIIEAGFDSSDNYFICQTVIYLNNSQNKAYLFYSRKKSILDYLKMLHKYWDKLDYDTRMTLHKLLRIDWLHEIIKSEFGTLLNNLNSIQ